MTGVDRNINDEVAAEIRARLGQLNLNKHQLAQMLGENDVWVGRRLNSGARRVPLDVNDLGRISRVLGVQPADLLPPGSGDQRRPE